MNAEYTKAEWSRAAVDALPGPTLLEFGTPWCGHCRAAQPRIAEAMAQHARVRHLKIEDGPGRRLGRSFKVKLWPTLVFLQDGKEIGRLVRPTDPAEIGSALKAIDGTESANAVARPTAGSPGEVFATFLKLGLTSFGGPIAHIGYFRRELVERRKWVSEGDFAQLLALCQFLPGPASSQMGFSLGLLRAGWPGAFAAFLAFTLPSAAVLFAFAALLPAISHGAGDAAIHGLKLVALCVVAQGVLGMSKQLCPDAPRATIAALAAGIILIAGQAWVQLLVVALGAAAGLAFCRGAQPISSGGIVLGYGPRLGWVLLAVFAALLLGLPLVAQGGGLLGVASAFYRAGALVFGGGHVVLPLLEESVVAPGWISRDEFLAGYGAAQAVPGPMFTISAYLGARLPGAQGGLVGATVALVAIFLPGFLLVAGVLPLWRQVASRRVAARAIAGVNAAVVGLLGAALYDPVWTSAVRAPVDLAIALLGFTLLVAWRASALVVVLWCIVASVAAHLLS